MKIRRPWLIRILARTASLTVRAWIGTLRFQCRALGPTVEPTLPDLPSRYIYAFWHENLLVPAYHYALPNVHVLISQHADGELIAQTAQHLGLRVVRGSATRGGVQALRQMVRLAEESHFVVTPDGPRGPRRQIQEGLVFLAARTGLPIVPVGIGMDRPWRAKSWDCLALPRPWTRARCVTGVPVTIPGEATREQFAAYRQQIQDALLHVGVIAEQWAETGTWPEQPARCSAA